MINACVELEMNPDRGKLRRMMDYAAAEIAKEHLRRIDQARNQVRNSMTGEDYGSH